MFTRIARQAKNYYKAQAELNYVDSLFENIANSNEPVTVNKEKWMVAAEEARATMTSAAKKISKLGGGIKSGDVYNAQGELLRSSTSLVA